MKLGDLWTLIHRPNTKIPITSLHQENFITLADLVKESSMLSNVSTFSSNTFLTKKPLQTLVDKMS